MADTNTPHFPTSCPQCFSDFTGTEIPAEHRHMFGNATHFSRAMGLYSIKQDEVKAWKCPDCDHTWDRLNKAAEAFDQTGWDQDTIETDCGS